MKKLIAFLLTLALIFSLAACSKRPNGKTDIAQDTTPDTGFVTTPGGKTPAEGSVYDSLIDWMRDGTFSYDFTLITEYDGERSESRGSMAMDGDNYALTTTIVLGDSETVSRIVVVDEVMYVIDDANKTIIKMSSPEPEMTAGLPTDYSGIELGQTGTGEVNGRTLPYEEYSSDGVIVRYYMDGGAVYAIESDYEGAYTLMIISNAKKTVPSGVFELPAGYAEITV